MSEPAAVTLDQSLKDTIQTAYRAWLEGRGFRARLGQRQMIAQVARSLTQPSHRVGVIEAGTGTGKTAGYCLAAIPIAQALGKTLVLSTATVALQEQVMLQDLPDLQTHAGLRFSLGLAKGRGRYICLKRLDDHLKYQGQQEMTLFVSAEDAGHTVLYQLMLDRLAQGEWDGELDSWPEQMPDGAWGSVTTDHRGCSNNRCSFFKQCPFFRARNALDGTDVVVANHDLVLSDLALGGGAVLPAPEDCIFVLDEAHHLGDKTQNHFSAGARIHGTQSWLEHVNTVLGSLTQRFARPPELVTLATAVAAEVATISPALAGLGETLQPLPFSERDEDLETHRFALGEIPEAVQTAASEVLPGVEKLCSELERTHDLLQRAVAGELNWENVYQAEDWLVPVGQLQSRALACRALLTDYAQGSPYRYARWINRTAQDLEMVSAPIEPGHILSEVLWQRCYAAICTSATLTALGRFERFIEQVGLDEHTDCLRIPSPFRFSEIATLRVPQMQSDPRDFDAHTAEVIELLPQLVQEQPSALVLFTSWRQLNQVMRGLPEAFSEQLLVQGEAAKQVLIRQHKERVDAGEPSCLVGLASFSEGVDLPDDYCRHVIIVKLPFAVPDDPIDQAMAEWAEAKGRNAFYEISVPDAALKLVQACGRLIRHENDHGQITMLDKRIVTQRYGRALLDSLPPYRRDLNYSATPTAANG